MIHTVYLDDKFVNVQEILRNIYCQEQGVSFDKPSTNGYVPEGYMTSEEFIKRAIKKVNTFCDKHDIL